MATLTENFPLIQLFKSVDVRVEKHDSAATIIDVCFAKINDFVRFHEICDATKIQVKYSMLQPSYVEATSVKSVEELNTRPKDSVVTQTALVRNSLPDITVPTANRRMNSKSRWNNIGAATTSENNKPNDIAGTKQRSTEPIVNEDNFMLDDALVMIADPIEVVMKSENTEQNLVDYQVLADENSRINNGIAMVTNREQIDVDLSLIKRETIWEDVRSPNHSVEEYIGDPEHCYLSGDTSVCEVIRPTYGNTSHPSPEMKVDPYLFIESERCNSSGGTSFWQMLVNGDEAIETMENTKSDMSFKTRENKQSRKNTKKVESEVIDNVARSRIKCQAHRCCKDLFESNEAMQFHAASYHASKIKKEFHCHLCKRVFGTRQQLRPHMIAIHIGSRPFKCPFPMCSMAFSYKNVLKQHINAIHTREISFKCTKCPRKFTRKEYLTRHLANKHSRGVTYCCYLCDKSMYAKRQLHLHMNLFHTGQSLLECPFPNCSKAFANKSYLKTHTSNVSHTKKSVFKMH